MARKQSHLLALALAAMSATGCSFVFVRPTPTVSTGSGVVVCGTMVAPDLDVFATLGLALGGGMANGVRHAFCETSENPRPCGSDIPAYIPAMIAAASSLYGFWAVSHCNKKLEELSREPAQPFPVRTGEPSSGQARATNSSPDNGETTRP
jgi:hypothetical protein